MSCQTLKAFFKIFKLTFAELTSFIWELRLSQLIHLTGNFCNYLDSSYTFARKIHIHLYHRFFLVNSCKFGTKRTAVNKKLRTVASDFMYVKPQSQAISVVGKQLLQHLLICAKVKITSAASTYGDQNVTIITEISWKQTEKIVPENLCFMKANERH